MLNAKMIDLLKFIPHLQFSIPHLIFKIAKVW